MDDHVERFESLTVPGLTDDEQATVNVLLRQLKQKSRRNILRESYYDGRRAIQQVGTVIPPQYYRLGLVLGWSAKAVDVLARRCRLDGFVWPGGDIDDLGMRELYDANQIGAEISAGITSMFINGVSFLVTTRGGEGEPAALLHAKDGRNATGTWNARRRGLDSLLSVTSWGDEGRVTGFVLYLPNLTITAQQDSDGAWQVDHSEHLWGLPVEPLINSPGRSMRPFGSSRISRPIMSLQDQALRELIRVEGHMDVYSFPELWMLGADESIFKNADGSQKASWQVMLGRIKGIPDDEGAASPRADVKHFPASSPEPHLAWLNALAKMFAREASLPDTSVAITDFANPTSADSYDASQFELIAEAERAMDDVTRPVRRTAARMLAMANGMSEMPDDWQSIDAKWRDPRYLSRAAQADAGLKQLSMVPWLKETTVGLELLGLSEQQIKRALGEKARAQSRLALDAVTAAADAITS